MYAVQGVIGGQFMRSVSRARMPWLTVDAAAEEMARRQEHCEETGRFLSGAVTDGQRDTQESIERCMSCPYPECRNCMENRHRRSKKRKQTAKELADSLRIHRCEEVGAK